MYLKQIELQGFKSFTEKTVLEFSKSGITGIVGPNGSGKSNISDAVKWVLGEQSPKSLRGGKMEDVIFAGTQNRKPVGFAEVSLIMDNEDHALNIDYSEVKVTRRLFRSGESEYLINNSHCKLKDITMLFADTGIGRDGYSIIGQGKIDEILSTKSEDRRSVFEDAAGISKYRIRKQEAERKLEQATQNADRVQDIIITLGEQLEPLTKQAEKAKVYLSLKYELRDIEVGVLADQIRRAGEHLAELQTKQDDLLAEILVCDETLSKIKEENAAKTELSKQAEESLSDAQSKKFELTMESGRLESEIKMCEERIKSIDEADARSEKEMLDYDVRLDILKQRVAELAKEKETAEAGLEKASAVYDEEKKKYDEIMALLSADSQETEKVRDELTEKKLQKTRKESGIAAIDDRVKLLLGRIDSYRNTEEQLEKDSASAESEYTRLRDSAKDENDKLSALTDRRSELQNRYDECNEKRDEYAEMISETNAELKEKTARLKVFEEYEKNLEGYGRSVKEILQLCRENKEFGKGIYGAVSQLITVSEKYELAIETALGGNYQNIVTETEEDAKSAIEFLKENKYGRATFLPISASKGRKLEPATVSELKKIPGYIGLATEVIRIDRKYEEVISSLLGRTAVFEDIDGAIFASRKFGYAFTSVTTEGEILRTSGAITGGSSDSAKKSNTLGRTREIPELRRSTAELTEKIDIYTKRRKECSEEADNISAELRKINGEIKVLEGKTSEFLRKTAAAEEKFNYSVRRIDELKKDIENEQMQIKNAEETAEMLKNDVSALADEIEEKYKTLASLEEKTSKGAKVRETMLGRLTNLQLDKNNCENNLKRIEEETERVYSEIEMYSEKKELNLTEKEESIEAKKTLNDTIEANTLKKESIEKETDALTVQIDELTAKKNELTEELSGMLEKLTSETEKASALKIESGRIENRIQKYTDETDACTTRLWEEYELTPTKAAEMTGGKPVENYSATQKRISELRNQIKGLGNVNVSAIEDLENTQKRYDFLVAQKKDIDESKEKANAVIAEVTAVMKKQFAEQFVLIRQNFNEMFVRLFGGGKADVALADNTNILESNIEINVQPPGKKLQNMMLLSGGERALTAIALLFGILRLRPAPFCLLDEIDSALDESNVAVFAEFMQNLTKDTQFIMITHRNGTMNVADTLYGVTMEEKGVSTVLSIRV